MQQVYGEVGAETLMLQGRAGVVVKRNGCCISLHHFYPMALDLFKGV